MNRMDTYTEIRCAEAHAEIKRMAQTARDQIAVQVGWMKRSAGQIRRFGMAKEHLQGEGK